MNRKHIIICIFLSIIILYCYKPCLAEDFKVDGQAQYCGEVRKIPSS